MATSSLLGGDYVPTWPRSTDVASLGPSDNTDSGSDTRGAFDDDELSSDTDAEGTGERSSVEPRNVRSDADILPDQVERLPEIDIEIEIETVGLDEAALLDEFGGSEVSALAGQGDLSSALEEEEEDEERE